MNIAAEKARLTRERDHAQEVGDSNEIERYVRYYTGSVNRGCHFDNQQCSILGPSLQVTFTVTPIHYQLSNAACQTGAGL